MKIPIVELNASDRKKSILPCSQIEEIDDSILLLNLTPRKVLGGLTPPKAFIGRRIAKKVTAHLSFISPGI
jgi:hypothetical protein